jgi:hypothetical protein
MIFCRHRGKNVEQQQLFEGNDTEGRFTKVFHSLLQAMPDDIQLGASKRDIGSHSNRKGAATYVLNMHEISAVQTYLRAGWTLGNVQDRYIFAGAGGDQLVGRAVCGLPICNKDFTLLPPHLTDESYDIVSNFGWKNILEGYLYYPECFRRTVPFLFCQIFYHLEFLKAELSPNHPLWKQRMFSVPFRDGKNIIDYLKNKNDSVITGYGVCSHSNLKATGIPSNLAMAQEVNNLRDDLYIFKNFSKNEFDSINNNFTTEIRKIPEEVKACILENFIIDGVSPLNLSAVEKIINNSTELIMQKFLTTFDQSTNNIISSAQPIENTTDDIVLDDGTRRKYFTWGGKIGRLVPQNYKFASLDVKTTWDLWHYGESLMTDGVSNHTYPLKRLLLKKHRDDINIKDKTSKENISRANKVIKALTDIALAKNLITQGQDFSLMARDLTDIIFQESFDDLCKELYLRNAGRPKRPNETIIGTIANKLYSKKTL